MANALFHDTMYNIAANIVDLDSHTFKIALVSDGWTPTATETEWLEVGSTAMVFELANGNGYTTGGATITKTLSKLAPGAKWDCADVAWTAATFTARYAVIYDATTSPLYVIAYYDFGANKTVAAGTFTLTINAAGLLTII